VTVTRAFEFEVTSRLQADRGRVWNQVSSIEGVNYELAPLLRMTHPPEVVDLNPHNVPLGERLFRSWILLFGLIPFDYDDLVLVRVEPPRGFLERSSMLSMTTWEHERKLDDAGGGCLISDRIRFVPRLPLVGHLLRPIIRRFFLHRHRRLMRRFGGAPAGVP
jgi:ligand-binding SRPBCC domain-containing protein